MPGPRLLIDSILMPDGNVLFINGAATGVGAFSSFIIHYAPLIAFVAYQLGAFHNVPDAVGSSNADHPGNTASQPSSTYLCEFILPF